MGRHDTATGDGLTTSVSDRQHRGWMGRLGRAIYIKEALGLTAWRAACYWSSALKPDLEIRVARRQRWYGFEARLND
jgi:hypothetical protein